MEEVLDDLAVPLQLFAKANGEVPCGRGVARGEDGVFVMGKGDMRAGAATNGDLPELVLLDGNKKIHFSQTLFISSSQMYKRLSENTDIVNNNIIQIQHFCQHHHQHSLI